MKITFALSALVALIATAAAAAIPETSEQGLEPAPLPRRNMTNKAGSRQNAVGRTACRSITLRYSYRYCGEPGDWRDVEYSFGLTVKSAYNKDIPWAKSTGAAHTGYFEKRTSPDGLWSVSHASFPTQPFEVRLDVGSDPQPYIWTGEENERDFTYKPSLMGTYVQ
ncbi:hypothetical protein BGX29_011391 [Mortierella sp. GBA35]|nr:hypothetical protein BGX29_011391 [Mortierella sp. GBA35]